MVLGGQPAQADTTPPDLANLGQRLFFDVNLSVNRSQSCATCHSPDRAYSDARKNPSAPSGTVAAVSSGAYPQLLGDRNAPALTYAALIPEFRFSTNGGYKGGFFFDGRAESLSAQVAQPLLDPREMAMPSRAALAARIRANPDYMRTLGQLFDIDSKSDSEEILDRALQAIVAFERSAEFMAFDSKYDRYLAGTYEMTKDETIGRELFFSDLVNCRHCHLTDTEQKSARELFTNFEYHNIGTPPNTRARRFNGRATGYCDPGLAGNPLAADAENQQGKFRVPSLRNVAVTAPYMHNGVFAELETAVHFYGRHLLQKNKTMVNPETGQYWRPAEVPSTVDSKRLKLGQPLEPNRVRHLVAFLKTLTDRRYEHLLD